jgi:hypothetical protein
MKRWTHRSGGLGVVGSNPATPTIQLLEKEEKLRTAIAGAIR